MAKSFKFFASYLDAACELNAKDRGDFLFAIVQYGINGEEVPLKKSLRPLWIAVKPNIDNSRKYQRSGEKGGRPKKPPFQNPETSLSENEKPDKDKDMDKEEDRDKDKNPEEEKDKQQPSAPPAAVAPHKGALGGKAESAPDTESFDVFADFANGDEELLKALRDYDRMRREKRKSLTQTMRRSLCQQLDEEFQPCEWVEIIKQATRQGWLKFYPLDKDKPTNTSVMDDYGKAQLDRILNNLISMNQGDQP